MRTRDNSPRHRGPGLSDITRAGDTETPSAEEGSAAQRDKKTVSGNDVGSEGELDADVDDDGVDVKNDDVDVDVENNGEDMEVENDVEDVDVENESSDGEVSMTVEAPSTWHSDWRT
ncbi:uncharacterized protein PITG_16452 [Phytophthora infestans T30-4]|uniref:Uncharacterized protein n=1 Tax=Phytophthora infestans (strain T30-4) TaxID=403677 RepID=D0NTN5_PHYIT|nr:uncharacterized protein PITG_16452 [Phytophthora infestans T30-4]EEY64997.1 hypothetical protein PITG_16452 [Phytophthora infestans T30-4]|eukprot:XP_002897485.1 hypothetical protein PITG_16452 [Phytophthora infestans T30-4]